MSNANFLNKNYSKYYCQGPVGPHSSRTFLHYNQSPQTSNTRQQNSHHLVYSPSNSLHNSASLPFTSNYCLLHTQQLIRHLCLDCIQLLCSQCINQHIIVHKQNNSFPNIQTLKQLKYSMNRKLEQLQQYMYKQKNHPKNMINTVDLIRKQSSDKIDIIRDNLLQLVQQWVKKLKSEVVSNGKYQQIKLIQQDMYALHDQISQLNNSLNSNNISVHDIKKAYQIDADRLQKCYRQMLQKYQNLSDAIKIQIQLHHQLFVQGLNKSVIIKIGNNKNNCEEEGVLVKKKEEQKSQNCQQKQMEQVSDHVQSGDVKQNTKNDRSQLFSSDIPLLFSMSCGTDALKIRDPIDVKNSYTEYQLPGVLSYPLNSLCLIEQDRIVISGGMIAQNKKNDNIQIYDYKQGKLIGQSKLIKGRSSHQTIVNKQQIYFIGGFTPQNQQCKQIQILKNDGIRIIQEKCRWGGPNLAIKVGNRIVKITVSGVEVMDLNTLQWQQITSDVPFALSKGMQVASYITKQGKQALIIFGDDEFTYTLDIDKKVFIKSEVGIDKVITCATTKNNKVYGLIDGDGSDVVCFDGEGWMMDNKQSH